MRSHMCLQVGTFEVSFAAIFKGTNVISSSIRLVLSTVVGFLLILGL